MARFYKSKTYLYRRFVIEKKSMKEIAEENGVTLMTIYNHLRKHGLL